MGTKPVKEDNMTPHEFLLNAILSGDAYLPIAKAAIECGANPNANVPGLNEPAIHLAVSLNRVAITGLLVEKGANLSKKNLLDRTPREIAVETGFSDLAAMLERAEKAQGEAESKAAVAPILAVEQPDHTGRVAQPKATHAEDAAARKTTRGPRQPGE